MRKGISTQPARRSMPCRTRDKSGNHLTLIEAESMLSQQLAKGLEYLEQHLVPLPEPYPGCILFFTVAAEGKAASVFHVRATTLEAAWREGATRVRQWAWARKRDEVDLRIDWAQDITPLKAGSPLPDGCNAGLPSMASLALADASLDRAHPLYRLLPCTTTGGAPGTPAVPPHVEQVQPPMSAPCLLLHLRGIYLSGAGPAIAIPRAQAQQCGTWTQLVPVHAALEQLMAQQREDGGWPGCDDICDHLGLTYTLLQAQRHAGSAALARSVARAMDHFEQQLPTMTRECVPRAMALLVLTCHLRNAVVLAATAAGQDDQHLTRLPAMLDQMAEALLAATGAPPALSWAELAMHAYAGCRPHADDSPTLRAARSALPGTFTLSAAFIHRVLPQLQEGIDGSAAGRAVDDPGARWAGMALVEGLQPDACLETQPGDILGHWRRHLLRQLHCAAMRSVWPEQALHLPPAQRRHAAFSDTSQQQVLQSPREIAVLLLCSLAGLELLDAIAPAPQSAAPLSQPTQPRNPPPASMPALGTPPGQDGRGTASGSAAPPSETGTAPTYPPLSWTSAELARFMQGHWLERAAAQTPPACTGLDTTRQHHLPGAAVLVRRTGMAFGVPGAALPTLRPAALISSSPHGLLRHDLPVLHVADLDQGLRGLAGAARRRIRTPVVAVTGCVGKTSTVGMLRQCLQDHGDARADALLAQGTALQMINWSETSPCALVELALPSLRTDLPLADPDILVITNLATSDIPRIRDAIASSPPASPPSGAFKDVIEAIRQLRRGSTLVTEHEIGINPWITEIAKLTGVKIITFGPHSHAGIREMAFHNGNLELAIDNHRLGISLQSDGHHMAMNAQAALATLRALGHTSGTVHASLAHWLPPLGAGQPQLLANGVCLLDHSLSNHLLSMRAAFAQLQSHAPQAGHRLVVLAGIQAEQGQLDASQLVLEPLVRAAQARRVLLYGEPLRTLAAALADLLHVNWYDDLNQLICSLLRTAHKGDTVLLAGRATTNLALAADAVRDSVGNHIPSCIHPIDHPQFDIDQKQMNLHS